MHKFNIIPVFLLSIGISVSAEDWKTVLFPDSENISGIQMFSADSGYVVTSEGNCYRTASRGKNWEKSVVLKNGRLESLSFLDWNTGWVCGHAGSIFFTADGGKTWLDQSWKDLASIFFDVQFVNKDTGIAVGMRPTEENNMAAIAIKTNDGGESWKKLEAMGMAYSEIRYEIGSHKLFFMSVGKMHISTDGGRKWRSIGTIEGAAARTFSIYGNTGIMAGPKGVCAYSNDSGQTWYKTTQGETEHFVSSVLVDPYNGYISGTNGLLLFTKDGGHSWLPETLPKTFLVMDMTAINGTVYAVGSDGNIVYKQFQRVGK